MFEASLATRCRNLAHACLWLGLLISSCASANPIFYEVDALGGDRWEYTYTVDNQTPAPIEEFTIWFDLGLYDNLLITGNPTLDWDGFAAQPDPGLPDDGFADWLTFGLPISPGETLSGFSVAFDWLAPGTPGSQFFQIVDPLDFSELSSGFTQLLVVEPPNEVPEPGTVVLLAAGLALLGRRR